ncbi:MAG: PAS domain S-box protein [Verrucomicrobiia bacterium]
MPKASAMAKVLVVDNEHVSRKAVVQSLDQAGYHVLEAGTWADCLRMTGQDGPDLVVLAVDVPEFAGIAICRELKKNPATSHLPIIQLSASFTSAHPQIDSLETGADACLAKPVEPRELLAHVRALLRAAKAEGALRESEHRYRALAESSPDAILVEAEGRWVYGNPAAARLLGAENRGHLIGRAVPAFVYSNSNPAEREQVRKAEMGQPASPLECVWRRLDGSNLEVEMAVAPILWQGRPAAQIAARNISERKRAEEAVRQNEQRLRLALDAAFVISFEWRIPVNEVRRFVSKDPGLGPTSEEKPDTIEHVTELVHPEDRERFLNNVYQAVRAEDGRYENEFRLLRSDGSVAWLYERGRVERDAAGRPDRLIGLSQDITERKQAEEALRESRERLRSVLENALDAAYRRDLRTDSYDYLSPVIEQVLGITPEQMRSMAVAEYLERIHPDDRASVRLAVEEGFRALNGRVEYRFRMDNGQYRWVADHFTVQVGPDGAPKSRGGILRDISSRKEAEQRLKESEQRLRLAQMAGKIGVHDYNPVTGERHWDERLRELWGLRAGEPVTHEVLMAGIHPEDRNRVDDTLQRALDPNGSGEFQIEHRLVRDGQTRWIAACGQATFEGGQPVRLVGTMIDITQQKEFQAELEREVQERTAQLQQLVRDMEQFSYSLAHDLRAPLRAMGSLAAIVVDEAAQDLQDEHADFLHRITCSAKHMDQLIQDVLEFSRVVQSEAPLAVVNLDRLVRTDRSSVAAPPPGPGGH